MKKRVLILCTGNSARSQMAEALLRHDAGDRFDVESAGTKPAAVRLEAIRVMAELGIDIRESCPVFPGTARQLHRGFADPAALDASEEERLMLFRRVRDELRTYLGAFARDNS